MTDLQTEFRKAYTEFEAEFDGIPRWCYWFLYVATFAVPIGLATIGFLGHYYFGE